MDENNIKRAPMHCAQGIPEMRDAVRDVIKNYQERINADNEAIAGMKRQMDLAENDRKETERVLADWIIFAGKAGVTLDGHDVN